MARLWAAKMLVEQAHTHQDLDANLCKDEHPLHKYGQKLLDIDHQLTDIVTRLGNDKLVREYENVCIASRDSKYFGKTFSELVPADAANMLAGVQEVVDQIVNDIE